MATNNAWNSQNPAQVAKGGTGNTTLANHNVIVGQGVNPAGFVAPGAAGIPLVSQGLLNDPVFGTMQVQGGGTGTTTYTPFSPICSGTTAHGAVHDVGPGVAGQILTSNGPGSYPSWTDNSFGQFSFFAYNNVAGGQETVTGNGTDYHIIFQSTTCNDNTVWDTVNSQFVAPRNGLFYFSLQVTLSLNIASTADCVFQARLNGPSSGYRGYLQDVVIPPATSGYTLVCNCTFILNTGDIVYPSLMVSGFGGLNAGLLDTVSPMSSFLSGFIMIGT